MRSVVFLSLIAASVAFTPLAPSRAPLSRAPRSACSLRMSAGPPPPPISPRAQTPPPMDTDEDEAAAAAAEAERLANTNPIQRLDQSWAARTTVLDRAQRVNNDPLAPKVRAPAAYDGQTMGNGQKRADVEREGYEWYKSMENKKSMFGRTINPLTGNLEEKGDDAEVINPLVDPVFYVIISVASPFVLMFAGAYSCVVPALSMAFGASCQFY